MATIDENGKLRDGRDRKADGTIAKLKSGRFVFNCSTCAEDFKHLEEIIGHINSVHSRERHGDIFKKEPNSLTRKIEPIASTTHLLNKHSDENFTYRESTSALPGRTQSATNESEKRKSYTPYLDEMNKPNPISRYNSKVRLDMIIFDSNKVKNKQHYTQSTPYNKSTKKERDSKPKLIIDRTKLADTISRLNIVNRRKESVELVANELHLRLTNSSDRLWLANKMKHPIDKMSQQKHKTNGSKKTWVGKKPMASTSRMSTDDLKGFTEKDSKIATLNRLNGSQNLLRLCRIKTEIDPTEVMHRYDIKTYRKEAVRFVAGQLNLTQSFELDQLRTKMRMILNQKKFSFKSGASSARFAIKKEIH